MTMRAFVVASLLALPLASPAAAGSAASATATIKGKVKVAGAGCRGVKLIPRTAESEREIVAMFGTTEAAGSALTTLPLEPLAASQGASLGRGTKCAGWTQGFRFTNVAPGDYFITALATGSTDRAGSLSPNDDGRTAIQGREPKRRISYLMSPISVSVSDRTV
jgi:hypothetical protein